MQGLLKKGIPHKRRDAVDTLTYEETLELLYTDALTGVYNRRYYEDYILLHEIQNLSVIDIDNFKAINDSYGHFVGDIVLQKIAKLICSSVGKGDTVIRYGGDEDVYKRQIQHALDENGFQDQYVLQSFGTSELGGKIMAEGKNLEADILSLIHILSNSIADYGADIGNSLSVYDLHFTGCTAHSALHFNEHFFHPFSGSCSYYGL